MCSYQQAVSNALVAKKLPAGDQSWAKVSMLNSPIASLTYYTKSTNPSPDQAKAKALVDFIPWAIIDGQKLAPNLHYVPMPAVVVKHNQDTLKSLTFNGPPLSTGP